MREVKCWKYGKWAYHFEKCIACGISKRNWNTRHKGKGLCINCFDKKRAKNLARKQALKNTHDRWYNRVKGTEEYKKYCREEVSRWQKNNPKRHRKNHRKAAMKASFRNFILLKNKNKTRKGIEILIDGNRVKTPILAGNGTETDNTPYKVQIFQQVYKELKPR